MKISLCIIVKDEESVIGRCLESSEGLFDEIILVDTGSQDKTKEILASYIDKGYAIKIYDFKWVDDFSAARNFAFEKAEGDYLFWLDADDIINERDKQALKERFSKSDEMRADVVMMKYHVAFDENDAPTFSYYRERILKAANKPRFEGRVHESITPIGLVEYWDEAIEHRKIAPATPLRNLRIYEQMLQEGIAFSAREQYYYARELYHNGFFDRAIPAFEEALSRKDLWRENLISAYRDLAECRFREGDTEKALTALFSTFRTDTPRAEVCCRIGEHFLVTGRYDVAAFWYNIALNTPINLKSGAFVERDYYGFVPAMQLCVCYDRLNDTEKAISMNELAKTIKPNSPACLYNDRYFQRKLKKHSS